MRREDLDKLAGSLSNLQHPPPDLPQQQQARAQPPPQQRPPPPDLPQQQQARAQPPPQQQDPLPPSAARVLQAIDAAPSEQAACFILSSYLYGCLRLAWDETDIKPGLKLRRLSFTGDCEANAAFPQLGFARAAANSTELQQQYAAAAQPLIGATRCECVSAPSALQALQGAISFAKQHLPQLREKASASAKKCGLANTAAATIAAINKKDPSVSSGSSSNGSSESSSSSSSSKSSSNSSSSESSSSESSSESSEREAAPRPQKRVRRPGSYFEGSSSSSSSSCGAEARSKRGRGGRRGRGGKGAPRRGSSGSEAPCKRGRGRGQRGVRVRGRGRGRGRGTQAPQLHGNARLRLKRVHEATARLQAAVEGCESLVTKEEEVAARLAEQQQQQQQEDQQKKQQQQQQQAWLTGECTRALLVLEAAVNCLRTPASKVLVGRVQDALHAHSTTIIMLPTAGLHGPDMHALLQHAQQQFIAAGHTFAADLGIPSLPCSPPTLAILTCDGGGSQAHKHGPQVHPTTLEQVAHQATAEADVRVKACRTRAGMPQAGKGTRQQQQQLKLELAREILAQQPQRLPAAFTPTPMHGNVPLHPAPPGVPFPAAAPMAAMPDSNQLTCMLSYLRSAPYDLAIHARYGSSHYPLIQEASLLLQALPCWSADNFTSPIIVCRLIDVGSNSSLSLGMWLL